MTKKPSKQSGSKPETESKNSKGSEGEEPEKSNASETIENQEPQEGEGSTQTEDEISQTSEGDDPDQDSVVSDDQGASDQDLKAEFDFNYKIAVIEKDCEAVPEGEFMARKFKEGEFAQGSHAQNMVSFGWARWITAEELEDLKAGNKAEG